MGKNRLSCLPFGYWVARCKILYLCILAWKLGLQDWENKVGGVGVSVQKGGFGAGDRRVDGAAPFHSARLVGNYLQIVEKNSGLAGGMSLAISLIRWFAAPAYCGRNFPVGQNMSTYLYCGRSDGNYLQNRFNA
ncbi:MAG: hypothetical protein ABR907_05055 [Terracidiphilus sp.]|jgi:hypothetical protein